MSKKTYSEQFFILLESPKKSEVNRHGKDSDENMKTMSACKYSNVIQDLTKQFVKRFSLLRSKGKKRSKM